MEIPLASTVQPGRPTLRDAETLDRLCDHIRQFGATDNAAAAYAGLHRTTLWRWKQIDPDLELRLSQAREQFRCTQLTIVMEGGRGWRAATWLLERVFPGDYHPRAAERARHKLAEAETPEPTSETPANSPEPVLQNSPATPVDSPVQSPATATVPSEPLLQNTPATPLTSPVQPPSITTVASEPVLQNPSQRVRPMSRKARRALERNQQRANRQSPTPSAVA